MPRIVAIEREMGRADADGVKQPHSIFAIFHELAQNIGTLGEMHVLVGPSGARIAEAHAIIRHALIGGGSGRANGEDVAVGEALARELVETYCYPARPAILDMALAWNILSAAIYGVADGSKKKDGEPSDPEPSIKAGSS